MKQDPAIASFDEAMSLAAGDTAAAAKKAPKVERFDRNGDGKTDFIIITHPDGRVERWVDLDFDGKWDTWMEDSNGDGKFDRGKNDADRDGKFDTGWQDANGDGKAQLDELTPIDPPEPVEGPTID